MIFKFHEGFPQDAKPKVISIAVVWYDGKDKKDKKNKKGVAAEEK